MPMIPSSALLCSRRVREVQARTVSVRQLTRRVLDATHEEYPDGVERPVTRGDCQGGERPCPFVSCRYHLYLDVDDTTGSIKFIFPDLDVDQMTESCALDVADRAGTTLEELGALLNVTRERIRQIENHARERMAKRSRDLRDAAEAFAHPQGPDESGGEA